jgi:pyrroloquinoline quinone biosynthesis protein E
MSETAKVDGSRRPVWLYCVLTYRCPLACATCHDPLDHEPFGAAELDTADWKRVLGEARALGALQVAFCGGEPAIRDDLEDLVAEASRLGLYGNLITGGSDLDASRLSALKRAGLNQVRLDLPSSSAETTALLCGTPALETKLACARDVKAAGLPLGLTVPVCRQNIDQTDEIISLAEDLGADFLEFAEVRPVHLVAVNQAALLPTPEQSRASEEIIAAARDRLKGRMAFYVSLSDHTANGLGGEGAGRPQACRNDWATVRLTVAPDGTAWPCRDAGVIENIAFPNVRDRSLNDIWHDDPAFNGFRGIEWMKPPCRSCDDRSVDYGGCRCQAYRLTGDAANADPSCCRSSGHVRFRAEGNAAWSGETSLEYRRDAKELVT